MAKEAGSKMAANGKRQGSNENGHQDKGASEPHKRSRTMSPGRLQENTKDEEGGYDVVVVGAGPAGLMLAANLVRFGIKTAILDDRPDKTATGRADGLQPKTIETLKQMRLASRLLERGVKFYDICFWTSSPNTPMRRTGREVHYPPMVDLLDPYMILVHQGMVEEVFLDDLAARGVEVCRNASFLMYNQSTGTDRALEVVYEDRVTGENKTITADYLVGCDGAHSAVRKSVPSIVAEGSSSEAVWGVLDGEIETNFPDFWSKAVVYSHKYGSILGIPRERNMTRLYIELKPEDGGKLEKEKATQEYVMERARSILQPYEVKWTTVEWFGLYQIGQRVANHFTDESQRVFIAGDASHTHSPKAAQGMNTSMHDSLNLAWKLNLVIRNLAAPEVLSTYEDERRKIAQDLIAFDFEHANAFHDGDPEALMQNFLKNVRFISGVGAEYRSNLINAPASTETIVQPGCLLPPAKVTRYMDANPVDIQLDIPMLGQFRMYFICPDLLSVGSFLKTVCNYVAETIGNDSLASLSYTKKPRTASPDDEYQRPKRYTAASQLLTPALLTSTLKADFEISDLPELLSKSRWTVYLDDSAEKNSGGRCCFQKWIGDMEKGDIAIVNVRPDGYVGSVKRWKVTDGNSGEKAAAWVQEYYSSFLNIQ